MMDDRVIDELLSQLDKLSEATVQGFEYFVKNAIIGGVNGIIFSVLLLLAAFIMVRMIVKIQTLDKMNYSERSQVDFPWYVSDNSANRTSLSWVLASIASFFVFLANLVIFSSFSKLLNPEYHALKEVFELIIP